MRWGSLALFVVLLASAAGCRGPGEVAADRPRWAAPESRADDAVHRFISAVGVATSGRHELEMLQQAESRARGELTQAVEDYVQSAMVEFLEASANCADPSSSMARAFTATVATEVSNAVLRHSLRDETWRDPMGGALYVLYRVPVLLVNNQVVEKTRAALGHVNPFGLSGDERTVEVVRQFLDGKLKERVVREARQETPPAERQPGRQPPQWLALDRHDDYPPAEFMTAIGLGDDPHAAEQSALVELAYNIETHMGNKFASLTQSRSEIALTMNLRSLRQDSLSFSRGDLPATKIAAAWYDGVTDTHYVFGVLDRQAAAEVCRAGIRAALTTGTAFFRSARNHHKADNYDTALREYLAALRQLQEAARFQLVAMVVVPRRTPEFAAMTQEATLAQVKTGLRDLMVELEVSKVNGDNQWCAPGTALPEPLVARLTAGEEHRALPGLPLSFRFFAGSGKLEEVVETGADGSAACTVQTVEDVDGALGGIACELGLEELARGGDVSGIPIPSAVFRYVLRSKANTFFAVCVEQRDLDGATARGHTVLDGLRGGLAEAGFHLVEQARVRDVLDIHSVQPDATEAELLRAFAGLRESMEGKGFLLVVAGEVAPKLVEETRTSRGDLYFVHARIALRVMDASVPEMRTPLIVTAVGKASFLGDPAEAARRAMVKATRLGADMLVRGLNEKFGER